MVKSTSLEKCFEPEKKWDKIFKALVKLLQNMQKDKDSLEQRMQYLQEVIHKMKMEQKVETRKARQILGLKAREAFIYQQRCENADGILADFRELCEYLSQKCSDPKDGLDDISCKKGSKQNRLLQDEVQNLKSKLEEQNTKISALLAEKSFVWNQYNTMESGLTNELKNKCDEAAHANAKVEVLIKRAEELEHSNEKLGTEFSKMKSENLEMREEISRLLKEIEHLKSRSGSATPVLRRCRTEAGAASERILRNYSIHGKAAEEKKDSNTSRIFERMGRTKPSAHKSTGGTAPRKKLGVQADHSSKRKAHLQPDSSSKRKVSNAIVIEDTPKLFTASFKVPKLRSSASPRV